MSSNIDYNALRQQTLGSGSAEEAVTVNTRALIDKVLARYSGEWTVLRELLQNAADASASKVTIKFETAPSINVPAPTSSDPASTLKHILLNHTLRRLLVTNNGQPFGANDWDRLKRIAEGNPDETKIGAFGVGFYSVFADCEEPFVSSGQEAMAFFWKGNSLFTRRLQLPEEQASQETSFVLDYRSQGSPVPGLLPLCQFLATSLTFVGLQTIQLWLDDTKILSLNKKSAPSTAVQIPKEVETKTMDGLMRVTGVDREEVQIDASWCNIVGWKPVAGHGSNTPSGFNSSDSGLSSAPSLRAFFSKLASGPTSVASDRLGKEEKATQKDIAEDLAGTSQATVFLRINTAYIRTSVSSSFAKELERATKKPPPKQTKLAILLPSYEERKASISSAMGKAKKTDIFTSVLPTTSGRVFIGFPTHQTTGLPGAHVSAPSVIPTVERESIDLNARYVRSWNMEMLRVAGIVSRIAWSGEMNDMRNKIMRQLQPSKRKISKEDVSAVLPEAIHVCKQFSFQTSTPSSQVGQLIEEAFWMCNKKASIEILSTVGVLPSQEVRVTTEDLSFVDRIPVLPEQLIEGAEQFTRKIRDYGLVSEITVADIQKELGAKTLDGNQLSQFLAWLGQKAVRAEYDRLTVQALLDGVVASVNGEDSSGDETEAVIVLAEIKTYINVSRIPADLPTPPSTIPLRFTRTIAKLTLDALGWEELQIVPWLRWLIENSGGRGALSIEKDLTKSVNFASQILPVISRHWDVLSSSSKETVLGLLSTRTVIPTKKGLRKPSEAYFPSVKLFDDLPVVTLNGVKEKFLTALGVRKTVELGVVFDRLMTGSTDQPQTDQLKSSSSSLAEKSQSRWSHVDLIRYLVSVRDDIPKDDINRLKNTPICPAEQRDNSSKPTAKLYKVSELFEPKDSLRVLGLPILQWPSSYHPTNADGKFLSSLGLRPYPTVLELIEIMSRASSANDYTLRDHALTYFIANHHINGYDRVDASGIGIPFLPMVGSAPNILVTPAQCFTNERAAILGFPILRKDLHAHALKFGVLADPPISQCVDRLIRSPPTTRREARELFGYFAGRLAEVGQTLADRLGSSEIVPVLSKAQNDEKNGLIRHIAPRMCFLGDSQEYAEIFDFVDFGQEANAFLLKCGSKHEPSKLQLARMVVNSPARLLNIFGSSDRYIALLRNLAESAAVLKKDQSLWKDMKRASFLMGYKEISPSSVNRTSVDRRSISGPYDDAEDEEEQGIREWSLASAEGIILVDDYISYSLFKENLLAAPQEEILEEFYYALGAPSLSAIIEEDPRIGSIVEHQQSAVRLQKQVLERSRLFLHDQPTEMIKHDTRWLEKNVVVKAVKSISLRRTLRGHRLSHTEKRTAAVTYDKVKGKGWTLWITADGYDLFQVSQALVNLLLVRPRPYSTMILETLLSSDLLKLKSRGYNVDRILRQKAAEARIAEDQRQKQLQEEQKQLQERERNWKTAQHSSPEKEREKQIAMPGAFADSPEHRSFHDPNDKAVDMQRAKKPRGLFSALSRHLGFEDSDNTSGHLRNLLGDNATESSMNGSQKEPPPPPYDPQDNGIPKEPGHRPDTVTPPYQLQQNLISAVQASRPHGSSDLFSRPQANNVKETTSYCDARPGQDISFFAESSPGIKIFLSNEIVDKSTFLATNSGGLNAFAVLLGECANVFALPRNALHIYYDQHGSTIAFNGNGALFCNFRFFQQLHLGNIQNPQGKAEAAVYWWVVLCHELAHNLVPDHSSDHSFYTENFVVQYFPRMMLKIAEYSQGDGRETGQPRLSGPPGSSLLD